MNMRRIVLVAVGLLALGFLIISLAEIETILATLRQSSPRFLLAAVTVEFLLLLNNFATFNFLYHLVELKENRRELFLMVTAANFVNVVAPSGGAGGVALLMNGARRRGLSLGRVTVAGVLYVLYDYASLFVILAAGFGVLIQCGKLNLLEMVTAGLLLLVAALIGAGLIVGYRSPGQLGSLLAWLARLANHLLRPFLKKDYCNVEQAFAFTGEIAEGLGAIRANHRRIGIPLLFTLTNKLLNILILALAFRSMGVVVAGQVVLAGFSIGQLFFYASITPSGVGFVDTIMPMAFGSLGIPLAQAVLVSMVYRAVTFWMPVGLGGIAFRYLHRPVSDRQVRKPDPLAALRTISRLLSE